MRLKLSDQLADHALTACAVAPELKSAVYEAVVIVYVAHFAALPVHPLLLAVAQMCVPVVVVVTGLVVLDDGVQSEPTFVQVWIVAPEVASENVTVTVPE
jgi:hypothetical protein